MSHQRVTVWGMSEPPEVEPYEAEALELLQFADSIEDEPYERDQMLARAQVYASLSIASALREVADATAETTRSMPSTSGIPELLAEISQAISQSLLADGLGGCECGAVPGWADLVDVALVGPLG
jgi:hypothetical protein